MLGWEVQAIMMDGRGGVAMGLGRVQARSQVTIPAEVRGALRIRPGDVLLFEATGPDEGRFRVVRTTRSLDQERKAVSEGIGYGPPRW